MTRCLLPVSASHDDGRAEPWPEPARRVPKTTMLRLVTPGAVRLVGTAAALGVVDAELRRMVLRSESRRRDRQCERARENDRRNLLRHTHRRRTSDLSVKPAAPVVIVPSRMGSAFFRTGPGTCKPLPRPYATVSGDRVCEDTLKLRNSRYFHTFLWTNLSDFARTLDNRTAYAHPGDPGMTDRLLPQPGGFCLVRSLCPLRGGAVEQAAPWRGPIVRHRIEVHLDQGRAGLEHRRPGHASVSARNLSDDCDLLVRVGGRAALERALRTREQEQDQREVDDELERLLRSE
jgi:hypothetical protein